MNDFQRFRDIADEIMRDIKPSQELKQRTLNRCKKEKKRIGHSRLLLAACVVLMLVVANVWELILPQQDPDEPPQANTLLGTDEGMQPLVGVSEGDDEKAYEIKTLEDAKRRFGDSFLVPSYVPDDFELSDIYAYGHDQNEVSKVVLTYSSGNKSFTIIEEKAPMGNELVGFEEVDINGAIGYLKPSLDDKKDVASLDVELYWFKDGVQYSVIGLITPEEAIKIATSMK
jgi:hypothetical protein